jgi:hypothetical protein
MVFRELPMADFCNKSIRLVINLLIDNPLLTPVIFYSNNFMV